MRFAAFALAVSTAFSGGLYAVGAHFLFDPCHNPPPAPPAAEPLDWGQVV